ncbi:MAG: Methionyl-tRNA formyltransferase [Candidatus Curtissbacteria bacterium GW2011_GWA1_40_16]|uniref:Methionyl-tRNA formyltransferase n=1 Tax=Candidatus Curtissbacteria bacterium GW2011_GWA1_40_16 TaxID=1618405 RepID=A0A0G0TVX6_9BACT|nr:MAG: Methionyl-tRNA formyltransferase [Candidatus Curtissbacteria bacterium GW2011_GWA1_40_16]
MKIAFLGTPRFAQIILEELIKTEYKPQLVITAPDQKVGRGQILMPSEVKVVAQDNGIEVRHELFGIQDQIDMAILVAFGQLIPENVLNLPKFGFINVHPSLLPKYRGPSPIQTAILSGEEKTGVSIMLLDKELDHGPILTQKELAIGLQDTYSSLLEKLAKLGTELLLETLPKYQLGDLKPIQQDNSKAILCEKITKESGKINVTNPPDLKTLDRMIRAFHPWPTVWTEIDGKRIKFLPEGKIQPEGKRPLTISEFKNGYPQIAKKIESIC